MDAKLRDDLFRRYVASLEKRLEGGGAGDGVDKQGSRSEEAVLSTATALLGAYQADPAQRFRLVRYYEVAECALRALNSSSLQALETAFATLETICTNLLQFPWKKEFRCIKTFTGPYVYQLQSAVCDSDLRSLLRSMGYTRDHELQYQVKDHPGGAAHLRQLAFELLLAQAECRLLMEVVALARGAATELEAVELRRSSREDAAGCAETLRHRDILRGDMSRLSVRPLDLERAPLRRGGRPSKSVDVTDGAGHWHTASKPVLKASLSLRKEPLFVDAEDEAQDEIIRPSASLFSVAVPPAYNPMADFFPIHSPSSDPYSYHLSSLDEMDLYTERGLGGRQTPSRPPSRDPAWVLKCQGCGLGCATLGSCQRCDTILCPSCHVADPAPCCGYQDFPKSSRPLDGYLPVKDKLSVYSHPHPLTHTHPQLTDKSMLSTAKLFPSKTVGMATTPAPMAAPAPMGGSRCGFCNKPGASHTCVNCSKVSCDSCMSLYASDVCTRRTPHHNFVSNHQLNFKSSTISHLVYR
ncbi:spermatogenesis-associated protein 2 [Denticeps clupeoides]|uniref:Spermatogenesis-associated protein 2 PUB-like domain-containing protein n=1 Tax=Denticeps clupeoides TaxID=299321 RepID=A0AAY4CT77_9TELE|nr:spermatogenesis-associated protein 2 [Denticeps clupeoides]XP_028850536.1 spermatogenesis-associated protein 2 [Denticeps clupeoides]XP_028850537.1 spermatogenesis-associated protein 2 [Denticeps clupeoides]